MKNTSAMLVILIATSGCGGDPTSQVQADFPIERSSVKAGSASSVTMHGNKLALSGTGMVEVGKPLPSAIVSSSELKPVDITDAKGKVRIISVVPSLDTPACEKQTHDLSEKNGGLDQQVELVTISMDLPFAQSRFAKEAKIGNITFLSDYKNKSFGDSNGLLIEPLELLARAVIVTDKDNIVRYLQVVPELAALPDLEAAMAAARGLL
jgi:thiol peroxidase